MSLAALQHDFAQWLTAGSDEAASGLGPEAGPGLRVYRNNYHGALMACLEESFAQTLAWIGSKDFRFAAALAIDARPPDSWSLDHYAAHFPAALAGAFPDDPEIADLAALELALTDAFVGPDPDPLTVADLPAIDWEHAILRWVPTARLLPMRTNAPAIWSALSAGNAPPAAARLPERACVLVWRQEQTTCYRALDPLETGVAESLTEGTPFTQMCLHCVTALGEAEGVQAAGGLLGRWVTEGLIVSIERAVGTQAAACQGPTLQAQANNDLIWRQAPVGIGACEHQSVLRTATLAFGE